ncbi:hypothetical protein [Chitinophaga sp. sic0106]|uniref:poly(ethylene terephthalate) hydrolase family protein n=1 Tax=Chitinophaga sp. sic0106 TaxID=2854785 RepID=UPI001C45208B|nr:hypothetical protein [Chitinophaga sp. sic0106]MBV7529384.1 hypothetical protein [Chitinophaga sp. sic0106]
MRLLFLLLATLFSQTACNKPAPEVPSVKQPAQPAEGYGGAAYTNNDIGKVNFDDGNTGFWLYYPMNPIPKEAPVIVFNHGYGAWNPACYGGWIRHLVRRGNIVIFPRYQATLVTTPAIYTSNAATAISRALKTIADNPSWPQPAKGKYAYVGHSYGAVVSANLALTPAAYGISAAKALILACPGTGNAPQGAAASYRNMSAKIKMLLLTEEDDNRAGTTFSDLLYTTTPYITASNKNFIIHQADNHGAPVISANHGEAASTDMWFDSGERNTVISASFTGTRTDATDYYYYWKLTDALLDCAFYQKGCDTALGNTTAQQYTGHWSDGQAVKPLLVK